MKMELEKMMHAKNQLTQTVITDLTKTFKNLHKKQKYDLNDREDIAMMDIIKRHQDHLENFNEGVGDSHKWLLMRENDVQNRKAEELEMLQT